MLYTVEISPIIPRCAVLMDAVEAAIEPYANMTMAYRAQIHNATVENVRVELRNIRRVSRGEPVFTHYGSTSLQ